MTNPKENLFKLLQEELPDSTLSITYDSKRDLFEFWIKGYTTDKFPISSERLTQSYCESEKLLLEYLIKPYQKFKEVFHPWPMFNRGKPISRTKKISK